MSEAIAVTRKGASGCERGDEAQERDSSASSGNCGSACPVLERMPSISGARAKSSLEGTHQGYSATDPTRRSRVLSLSRARQSCRRTASWKKTTVIKCLSNRGMRAEIRGLISVSSRSRARSSVILGRIVRVAQMAALYEISRFVFLRKR